VVTRAACLDILMGYKVKGYNLFFFVTKVKNKNGKSQKNK